MRGFKDSNNKFHPITQSKGVRSRRDTTKTKGVLRKERSGHKCYFCNSTDTQYCGMCGQYMCQKHMKNYPKRLEGMITEARMKRYRKKLVEMTPTEIKSLEIVGDIEENFDGILARTAMNKNCKIERGKLIRLGGSNEDLLPEGTQVEEICGAVTDQIEKFIEKKYGKDVACAEEGMYTGEGAKNSAGFVPSIGEGGGSEVRHEWIRLEDGTIIDGAGGQFVSDRKSVTDEDRLRIITPDDPRQKWYNPNSKVCKICGGRLVGGKCPSPSADKVLTLVDKGFSLEEAKEMAGLK